jgi:acylpyruvate hydrolase
MTRLGRNYAKHAKELGNAIPEKPFFFLKPTSSYIASGGRVEIPRGVIVHHEGHSSARAAQFMDLN